MNNDIFFHFLSVSKNICLSYWKSSRLIKKHFKFISTNVYFLTNQENIMLSQSNLYFETTT